MNFLKKVFDWITKVDVVEITDPTEAELLGINEVETIVQEKTKTLFVIMPAWEVEEFASNCKLIGHTPIEVLTAHVRKMNLEALDLVRAKNEQEKEEEVVS